MKIRYGINKIGKRGKIMHENHMLSFTNLRDSDWDKESTHMRIRNEIRLTHPGWQITGYTLIREQQ